MAKLATGPAKGLLTSGRRVGQGRNGRILVCDNVLIRHDSLIVPRFGFETLTGTSSGADKMVYDPVNTQILRMSSRTESVLDRQSGTSWTSLDSTRQYSSLVTSRNFSYLLSSEGLRRINVGNTATEIAFVPEGLDVQATLNGGASGFMTNNTQVAYRVVWGIKNSNNEFFLGAPSGRVVLINSSGGADNVDIVITRPEDVTTDYFFQIYRTRLSTGVAVDPGDEMFLIYEAFATGSGAGTESFTDYVPDNNGGASLYTNETQEGAAQGNHPCEAATGAIGQGELAVFADCIWASNYQPRSTLTISLLSVLTETGLNARTFTADTNSSITLTNVSSFAGIAVGMRISNADIPAGTNIVSFNSGAGTITLSQAATATNVGVSTTAGDRLTIDGNEYIAWTAETIANDEFLVSTAASAAQAIRETAESFVRVFNRSSTTTDFYAHYLSGPNDLPGKIRLVGRADQRDSASTAVAQSHGTAWSPSLSSAQTMLSKLERGRLSFSKPNEPQAWPLLNTIQLPENANVLGLTALRTALMVWTDLGLYRISGTYGNFLIEILDRSALLVGDNTNAGFGTVTLNNKGYGMTNKGLLEITEASTEIVSGPVDQVSTVTLGDRHLYIHYGDGLVFVPGGQGTTWVYNTELQVWVRWGQDYRIGAYDFSTNLLHVHQSSTPLRARDADYLAENLYDSSDAVNIDSISSNVLTISGLGISILEGDVVVQGANETTITNISGSDWTVTDASSFTTGAATVYAGYPCSVTFCPLGEPSNTTTKHLRYANVVMDGAAIDPLVDTDFNENDQVSHLMSMSFATDQDDTLRTTATQTVTSSTYPDVARFIVPTDSARCSMVVPKVSWHTSRNILNLLNVEIDYEPISDKTRG